MAVHDMHPGGANDLLDGVPSKSVAIFSDSENSGLKCSYRRP